MATYIVLNIVFIAVVSGILRLVPVKPSKVWWMMLVFLIVLTAVFDNVLIFFDIVRYAEDKLLGVYIGIAPIEDFFYAVLAALLIPVLWNKIGKKNATKS